MIHDAKVEITCDCPGCNASEHYDPPYVYTSMSGAGGHYDVNDEKIEEWLPRRDWVVRGGKHYCCEECADSAGAH